MLCFFLLFAVVWGHGGHGSMDSHTIRIRDKVQFNLESPVIPVGTETKFNFTVLNLEKVHPLDWIGIFRWKEPHSIKDSLKRVLQSFKTGGEKEGTHRMRAPEQAGNYVFRYMSGGTGEVMEESVAFMAINCSTAKPDAYSNIKHVVLIVQENHSFDNYFSSYCEADYGSRPHCNDGPDCCEKGPLFYPGTGLIVTALNDVANAIYDPNHNYDCEIKEINGGRMDKFLAGAGLGCSSLFNFAYATDNDAKYYHSLASQYAMNDRYFQSLVGATASNNVFLVRAEFLFYDNACFPIDAIGSKCNGGGQCPQISTLPTIGDMFKVCNIPYSAFAEGYDVMKQTADNNGSCPTPPKDCVAGLIGYQRYPCSFDPSDIPFQYFTSLKDDPNHMQDLTDFFSSVSGGTLPALSYVKPIGYKTEHPGGGTTLTAGMKAVKQIVDAILNSPTYKENTLIVFTYDEGGGYFDHIPPPPNNAHDGKPYGTRIPFLTLGHFAKQNYISHTLAEHASVVKFLEWNWFGEDGQLETRDALASHFTDMLDQNKTGPLPAPDALPWQMNFASSISPSFFLLSLLWLVFLR